MEKIKAQIVIEILGRPVEHVTTAINQLIEKLGIEKGVKIVDKTIHEPNPVEKSDLFTTFADITVELDSLANYFGVVFAYMPSHIEIISPEEFAVKNFNLTELGNNLLSRLHHYDSITKTLMVDRNNLLNKLKEVAPQLFVKPQENQEQKPEEQEPKESKAKTKKSKKK